MLGLTPLICVHAQTLETGVTGGISYYNGDLNPAIPYYQLRSVYGLLARYNAGTRWAFTSTFTMGQYAFDATYARTLPDTPVEPITAEISTISVVAEFNFYDYFTGSEKDFISPYIFGGIGAMTHRLDNEPIIFPFGLGVKYSLSERLGASAEWRMNKTFTDTLDGDVPGAINDAGNNDWTSFTTISLTYKFVLFKKYPCNNFKNRYY